VGTVVGGRRQIQEEAVSVFSDIRAWLAARRGVRSQVPLLFTAQQGSSTIAGPDQGEPAASHREPGTSEAAQAVRESTSPDPGEGRAGAVGGRIDWDPVEPAKPTLDGTDKAGGQSQPPLPEPVMHHDVLATTQSDSIVPRGLQVAAAWSWRLIAIAAMVYGLGWIARYLSEVLVPVVVAILVTALLQPVANRLRKWRLPRGAATAVTVLGGLALIAGVLALITTQIVSQSTSLSGNVVSGFNQLVDWLESGPLNIDPGWFDVGTWGDRLQSFLADSRDTIASYAADISAGIGHFFAGLAIMLFSLFYFLYDGRGIFTFLLKLFPSQARERVDEACRRGWGSLSSFVRATILVAFVDAIGVLIAALIIGVPLAPALAALVFLGAFVPIVGALVAGFVAVLVALVALGWVQALIMLGAIILVQQVEGHVLQPFLMGRAVKLHPLAVIIGIAAGIIVGGIVGALIAVPILAFGKAFIQYLAGVTEPPLATAIRWPSGRRRH
jgi:predicted PurR-regulated permease PerM